MIIKLNGKAIQPKKKKIKWYEDPLMFEPIRIRPMQWDYTYTQTDTVDATVEWTTTGNLRIWSATTT